MSSFEVLIVAGGQGSRMKSEIPKQFLLLAGKPILMHTIERFYFYNKDVQIIVVLPKAYINYWKELCEKHEFKIPHKYIEGGQQRFHSVRNGLSLVDDNCIVAIHDAVRPFVTNKLISEGYKLASLKGNAIPFIIPTESIRILNGPVNKIFDRNNIAIIQTPQFFLSDIIKKAYKQPFAFEFTDDASVVEKSGNKIFLFNGYEGNIKITTQLDLTIAEAIYKHFVASNFD